MSGLFGLVRARASRGTDLAIAGQPTPKEALRIVADFEDSALGWFWSTDAEGRIRYISATIASALGHEPGGLVGKPLTDLLIADRSAGQVRERTLPFVLASRMRFGELAVRAEVGTATRWWALSGRPQFDAEGAFTGFRGNATDITTRRDGERDANRLAMYDPLTGISNRARMNQVLGNTLSALLREKRSLAVLLIDLDRFKQVNDTLGHPAGDALLKQAAERLGRVVGPRGEIGRLGGDEFQVLVPDVDDRGTLGELGKEIIANLSQPYTVEGGRVIVGASVGIATAPYDGFTPDELVRAADLALYAAKGAGRGRFAFYSRAMQAAAQERRVLEEDLRDALGRGELWLAYQPVISAATNRLSGFEALLRWNHPERGPISPALFIPIAEETELIVRIGEWALRQACEDAVKWPHGTRVAVNVSPIQFSQAALPSIVASALASSGLSPELLELEITESVFLADSATTDSMFGALKGLGVRLALDDFGTGYSSLAYLRTAPFDKIKIDQSFVRGATQKGNRNAAIITAIVSLAAALEMDTTAEGLETLDQLALIRKLGVSHIQGYVYSKPIDQATALERFAEGTLEYTPRGPDRQRHDRRTVFRKVGAIHEDFRYEVTMRNLSATGALIEGICDVPVGTRFVIDFGDGQLAVATVRRSMNTSQGVEFEEPLVSDGSDGFCTRHRVPPYLLAAAGMPHLALPKGLYSDIPDRLDKIVVPRFAIAG